LLIVSHRTLNILAALFWFSGGIALLLKGSSLLLEADIMNPEKNWPWAAAMVAVLIGGIKAKFLFSPSCRKNLVRIAALKQPNIWQFFKPTFLVALILMIMVGATLSKIALGNYPLLLVVGALDLTIATALLGSSYVFWMHESSAK
jgi:hypothetical protein